MVDVRESHPTDGWVMASNAGAVVELEQLTTYRERVKACGAFSDKLKPSFPVLVDEIDDRVGHGCSGMPGRLHILDRNGRVAYKSGRGPFGFRAGELEQALVRALVEEQLKTEWVMPALGRTGRGLDALLLGSRPAVDHRAREEPRSVFSSMRFS